METKEKPRARVPANHTTLCFLSGESSLPRRLQTWALSVLSRVRAGGAAGWTVAPGLQRAVTAGLLRPCGRQREEGDMPGTMACGLELVPTCPPIAGTASGKGQLYLHPDSKSKE